MTRELPILPKCPKCGKEPEWWSYYAKGGRSWGVSLMCECSEIYDTIPFDLQRPLIMRMNRCKQRMARKWKEYVKGASDDN